MKKNWLKILIAVSAIMIAGSAAFFSVTGLGVLFSGAAIAVMIMAVSLEFAKLVTATYLKQEWDNISGVNKWYLTSAVVILMVITSAGIFGYLSNAFQQQNIKLDQVAREIQVWQNKIDYTNQQIVTLQGQQKDLSLTQNTLISKGNVNNRLLRSVDNRDKQSSVINKKINSLQDSIIVYNGEINNIKNTNIGIEREVGGFRFVAESFGVSLNSVVKFFIFLIVIVFDPLAVALIIAFNGLIVRKKEENTNEEPVSSSDLIGEVSRVRLSENDLEILEKVLSNPPQPNENLKQSAEDYKNMIKREEILSEIMQKDQELGLYDEPHDNPMIKKDKESFPEPNQSAEEMNENSIWDVTLMDGLEEEPTEEEINENFSTMNQNEENIFQDREVFPALSDEEVKEMFMKEYENPGYIEEEYPGQFEEWENETVPQPFATQEEIASIPVEESPVEIPKEDEKKK